MKYTKNSHTKTSYVVAGCNGFYMSHRRIYAKLAQLSHKKQFINFNLSLI